MSKTTLTIIVIILFLLNIFLGYSYFTFRNNTNAILKVYCDMSDEYSAIHNSFHYSLLSGGKYIGNVEITDTLNNVQKIKDLFVSNKSSKIVCRFSDKNCNSCLKNAISVFLKTLDSVDKKNILFFAETDNSKTLKLQKKTYSIDDYDVFNVQRFNSESEYSSFPYYFLLDSSCRIVSTYFPSKSINGKNISWIKKMYSTIN